MNAVLLLFVGAFLLGGLFSILMHTRKTNQPTIRRN